MFNYILGFEINMTMTVSFSFIFYLMHAWFLKVGIAFRAGRYEVDGYIYNAAEEPTILMTGKWNESLSYQPCDMEGEPLSDTELKEVILQNFTLIKAIAISFEY